MLGGRDCFGAKGRESVSAGELGHPVRERSHRNDLDIGGQRHELSAERASLRLRGAQEVAGRST
jgi:hypothetical protein